MADGTVTRVVLVVALLAIASACWWLVSRRRGSIRTVRSSLTLDDPLLADVGPGSGHRLTLIQFSAPVCAPCAHSWRTWQTLAGEHHDIRIVQLPAQDHLALLGRLGILTTPATAVFDARRRLAGVISGPPDPEQVRTLAQDPDPAIPAASSHTR